MRHFKLINQNFLILLALTILPLQLYSQTDTRLPDAAMNRDINTVRALLAENTDPDTKGPYDTPALHWLVRVDELETTRLILEAGADPNSRNGYGVTPLSLAVNNGNDAMVKLLLDAGADANTLEATGEAVLMSASALGNKESVRALLEHGAVVDYADSEYGQTALMFASRAGHKEIVAMLLEAGANPNNTTYIGETPPWVAPNSQRGFGFGVGIIRGGTPADRGRREPIPGGMSPLLYAARHDHLDVAKLLLAAGADINHKDANDIYPLLIAISNNSMAVANYLLEQGSVINDPDWYGRTPLWEAVNVRNLYVHNSTYDNYIDNRDEILDLITSLLKAGANVNARTKESPPARQHLLVITGTLEWVDFTGQTPFLSAALAGDVTVMKLLLEYNADPHIYTFEGTTPLMAAAGINWVYAQTWTESPEQLLEAVKLSYELGMDVNHTNSMGLTAAHGAANRGSDDILQFLIDKGADLTIKDVEGRTPLDWAKGVFLATHPAEPSPSSIALISETLKAQGKEVK